MKGKYITTRILLACLSKPAVIEKDIHTQLAETIAEHKRIMQQWKKLLSLEQDDFVMPGKKAAQAKESPRKPVNAYFDLIKPQHKSG